MKKHIILAAVLLSASSLSLAASIQSLNKNEVIKTLNDKTITTTNSVTLNNQIINNSFTGYFSKDGKINGQFANKPENDQQTDTGKWVVKNDGTLCATWDHWDNSKPICVSVYKLNNGILFINQKSKRFEALVLDDSIKQGNTIG